MEQNSVEVIIGMGTCGISAGAERVKETFESISKKEGLNLKIGITGCIGICYSEVNVEVKIPGAEEIIYGNVTPEAAEKIIRQHIVGGGVVKELAVFQRDEALRKVDGVPLFSEHEFYSRQRRRVLDNCGRIDPESIEDYLKYGGYESFKRILLEKVSPDEVIQKVKDAGLRGRGGGGFLTGVKWEFARQEKSDEKYVVCNADEGDPGAFMDRSILEGDPHAVIEGMAIAGYAIGASKGYVYVRLEYPLATQRIKKAIEEARRHGFLGKNILGSGFDFDIKLKAGAGAFVCGEETALLASIEGKRGMPRTRPPFPAVKGLWGKPTIINNVETLANVRWIFKDFEEFTSVGTPKSRGTKVFAITGQVERPGLAEVPMGITLREIVFGIGGGISEGNKFKAVQIGGPSGGCLPEELLDIEIDYDTLKGVGAMVGSGGLVVMDDSTCMVDVARFFMDFIQKESCGTCTPCREGTTRMLEILEKITAGKGEMSDLDKLKQLAGVIARTSLCGLGQTAPNPVLTTLKYFRDEYVAHIKDKKCPARVCTELLVYVIDPDLCVGCHRCAIGCPVGAIMGRRGELHAIDNYKCTNCGGCVKLCKVGAISRQ